MVVASDSEGSTETEDLPKPSVFTRILGANFRLEVLCGLTVALALVPEAVAFALAAGLPPDVGLNSAWIISVFTAIFGGRPGMICGATGSLAVLVPGTVSQEHGKELLFYAVIVMGLLEVVLGLLSVGTLVKLIPVPVMIGFCNGLALVIGLAQISNFKDPEALHQHGRESSGRRLDSFHAFTDGVPFVQGKVLLFAGLITALSFFVSLFLPKLSTRVPSALVAILLGTAFEWLVARIAFDTRTPIVGDIASQCDFPVPFWFNSDYPNPPPFSKELLIKVLPLSVTMAAVGLLESLMTLNLIDEITKTKGNPTRECLGQGLANLVCGCFGGMGGCAMIGQSMINIGSGARSRLSSLSAGAFLLAIVLVAYPAIKQIPVSALVGVMFNVCFHTFEWSSLKLIFLAAMPLQARRRFLSAKASSQQIRRTDALVIIVVTLVTLFTDLATAVAVGMVISLFVFALETSNTIQVVAREDSRDGVKVYDVHGTLFFGSTSHFLELFDEDKDPDDVRLVFETGHVADFSAVQALNKLGERYGSVRKRLTLQQLMPKTHRVLSRAQGLLVEEITLSLDREEVLPARETASAVVATHLHIERIPSVDHSLLVDRELSRSDEEAGPGL
ncbi:ybaR [Symbiodinium natans]|uniref:YbaR protein n=1 Tax=Symbiodinium natans TaxID=878477 RepID=A0A812LKK8_9DINO|nr:ybaR [Symbiodinium natans]